MVDVISNFIIGLDGNDSITGGSAADVLDGGAGNDTISGGWGNDTIIGGAGDDSLNDSYGNDTYVFNLGDGADTITDYDSTIGNSDRLKFGTGISADAIQLSRSGNDLTFTVNASDKVTVKGYFDSTYSSWYRIETVAFADGTTWDVATTIDKLTYNGTAGADTMLGDATYGNHINGLDGNDSITGGSIADVLDGGAGNDTISGGWGNDTITGGAGDDSLNGSTGNDTYVFNLGDGADTITDYDSPIGNSDRLKFGTGISADAIQLSRSGNDLTFTVNASDKVTVKSYFDPSYGPSYRIETIAFADGTTWDVATTIDKLTYNGTVGADTMIGEYAYSNHINGLDGNDSITGGSVTDVLIGGLGNDTLRGGTGNDTYVFNVGDGTDTIIDYDTTSGNNDKLQFGSGISADAIQLSRSLNGNDLTLSVNGTGKVTLTSYFSSSAYRIETVTFADGTNWDYATIVNKLVYNGSSDADTLSGIDGYVNRINGLEGNDSISGGDKADVLTGGTGNDTLRGSTGNDTYVFNVGDGTDTIIDYDTTSGNNDKLQFGSGISADAIQLSRSSNGNDLTLSVNGTDKVTLTNYFYSSIYRVETIAFADGTAWDVATTLNKPINGTTGADTLYGIDGYANRINGMEGNDSITGADKDDVLTGGLGNDTLRGGTGNDTYVFNVGDGADTIIDYDTTSSNNDKLQFGSGISADVIQLSRSSNGNDLTLSVNGTDKVTLTNYFYSSIYRVETIAFADGTAWDVATTLNKPINGTTGADTLYGIDGYANRINGMEGNDSITGADKDDVLDGGTGNDTISGGAGNDTIIGGTGSDVLTGGTGNDIFKFITPNEGSDSISDFTSGTDVIQLVGSNFGLTAGAGVTLISGTSTPAAVGSVAQFLYNTTTGDLYFDQDGADAAYAAIQIAKLTGQKTLAASDIVVV